MTNLNKLIEQQKERAREEIALSIQDGTLSPEKIDELTTQTHQATIAEVVRIVGGCHMNGNNRGSYADGAEAIKKFIIEAIKGKHQSVWRHTTESRCHKQHQTPSTAGGILNHDT